MTEPKSNVLAGKVLKILRENPDKAMTDGQISKLLPKPQEYPHLVLKAAMILRGYFKQPVVINQLKHTITYASGIANMSGKQLTAAEAELNKLTPAELEAHKAEVDARRKALTEKRELAKLRDKAKQLLVAVSSGVASPVSASAPKPVTLAPVKAPVATPVVAPVSAKPVVAAVPVAKPEAKPVVAAPVPAVVPVAPRPPAVAPAPKPVAPPVTQ